MAIAARDTPDLSSLKVLLKSVYFILKLINLFSQVSIELCIFRSHRLQFDLFSDFFAFDYLLLFLYLFPFIVSLQKLDLILTVFDLLIVVAEFAIVNFFMKFHKALIDLLVFLSIWAWKTAGFFAIGYKFAVSSFDFETIFLQITIPNLIIFYRLL